jgi:hypothetical protein
MEIMEEEIKMIKTKQVSLTSISDSLTDIKKDITRVHERMDDGDITITIHNGQLTGEYKLNEFVQVLYDRPKDAFKKTSDFADRLTKIFVLAGSGGMIIYWIIQVFKMIPKG